MMYLRGSLDNINGGSQQDKITTFGVPCHMGQRYILYAIFWQGGVGLLYTRVFM